MNASTVFGLSRMRPYRTALPAAPEPRVVFDPRTQQVRRFDGDGSEIPVWDRHKRTQTPLETSTQTGGGDGHQRGDNDHDQHGDQD